MPEELYGFIMERGGSGFARDVLKSAHRSIAVPRFPGYPQRLRQMLEEHEMSSEELADRSGVAHELILEHLAGVGEPDVAPVNLSDGDLLIIMEALLIWHLDAARPEGEELRHARNLGAHIDAEIHRRGLVEPE